MLSACVTTNASRLGNVSADRLLVAPGQVTLYRVASQVPGKYEEVALLNSKGDSNWTDEFRMFESMREKAGEMGANVVILDAVSEPGHGAKVAAAIFGVSVERKGSAVAIWVMPANGSTIGGVTPASTQQPVQIASTTAQSMPAMTTVSAERQAASNGHAPVHEADPAQRCDACGRLGAP